MFSWLRRALGAAAATSPRDALLNEGLKLAMEWGQDFLEPVQGRLGARHPDLSGDQLDELNATCQAAMKFGHDFVYGLAQKSGGNTRYADFEPAMKARYPWVDAKNVGRLFNQGMYYAWKDGYA